MASLPDALAPRTAIRPARHGDDEGGPGDTPASVAWLREGRGTGYAADRERLVRAGGWSTGGRSIRRAARSSRRPAGGRPGRRGRRRGPARPAEPLGPARAADRARWVGAGDDSSVARVEPEPPPQARGGSTVGLVRLGALARVLRPHRWLPAPPLDPLAAACS